MLLKLTSVKVNNGISRERIYPKKSRSLVSLSSAGSEFCAIGSGCARRLTIKHVLLTTTPDTEIGMTVCTDSDAARGMIQSGAVV